MFHVKPIGEREASTGTSRGGSGRPALESVRQLLGALSRVAFSPIAITLQHMQLVVTPVESCSAVLSPSGRTYTALLAFSPPGRSTSERCTGRSKGLEAASGSGSNPRRQTALFSLLSSNNRNSLVDPYRSTAASAWARSDTSLHVPRETLLLALRIGNASRVRPAERGLEYGCRRPWLGCGPGLGLGLGLGRGLGSDSGSDSDSNAVPGSDSD